LGNAYGLELIRDKVYEAYQTQVTINCLKSGYRTAKVTAAAVVG